MKLKFVFFAALLALTGSAFGATPPPPASTGMGPTAKHQGPCERDPSQCQAEAAKFDNWCQANADKCVRLKAWAEKRREFCEANKPKCEKMRQKMHEHMKKFCASNPDDEHCKMMMDKKGDAGDMGGEMPPPPGV
jgi:hypothetical protein